MDKAAASVKKSVSGLYDFLSSFCYIWWLEMKSTVKDEGV